MTKDPLSEERSARLDSVADFAEELRRLRRSAGDPTLESIARSTGVSKSVIAEAFSGTRLPTTRTVEAIASVTGAPAAGLVRRRDALEASLRGRQLTARKPRRLVRISVAAWTGVAGLLIGAVIAIAATSAMEDHGWSARLAAATAPASASPAPTSTIATPLPEDSPQIVVPVGSDPAQTPCVNDATIVASQTRTHDTQLQIIWSQACHAAWARVTRYDGKSTGNLIKESIYRQIAPHASDRQDSTDPDAQSAYTFLLIRSNPDERICATGSITVSGKTIDLGQPLCT